ncbi:M48 family metallopeptidase [Berryella intestinalis]|uniref:M48 family metallopeptidase n=1 Tax=Berryella intestinalis TaxID=1531429 RepID=UPI001F121691|nr:SprT-like domain-containing protein [Berryella intestinalis]
MSGGRTAPDVRSAPSLRARRVRLGRGSGSGASVRSVLTVDGLAVHVARKDVRTIRLRVRPPEGRIEVSAPFFVADREIEDLVRSKRAWLAEKQREVEQSVMARAERADAAEIRAWRAAVEAAAPVFVAKWERIMGVRAGRLAYRNMRSRWGSCQPATGRICLNVRLALYPPECLEYVVVHELAHLIVAGHGREFHRIMDRFLPDWRTVAAKLR